MLALIKKTLAPKEVKAAFGALDEAEYHFLQEGGLFRDEAVSSIRQLIEKALLKHPDNFAKIIQNNNGRTPREWVYSQFANIAADMLESGRYHVFRGALDTLGPGEELLNIHDASYDVLLEMKAVELEYAEKQKAGLRENIGKLG